MIAPALRKNGICRVSGPVKRIDLFVTTPQRKPRESNASILECFEMIEAASGRKVERRYDEKNREGDHICYISDMAKFRAHYPRWSLTRRVPDIIDEMVRSEAVVS